MQLGITPFLQIPDPWKIVAIGIADDASQIGFVVAHDLGTRWTCPHYAPSAATLACRDHIPMRKWRHQNFLTSTV